MSGSRRSPCTESSTHCSSAAVRFAIAPRSKVPVPVYDAEARDRPYGLSYRAMRIAATLSQAHADASGGQGPNIDGVRLTARVETQPPIMGGQVSADRSHLEDDFPFQQRFRCKSLKGACQNSHHGHHE